MPPSPSSTASADQLKGTIAEFEITDLVLDSENPRLPEDLHGTAETSKLLNYYFEEGVLLELAQSFVDNGYFLHEPLIVLKAPKTKPHVVLEGNRRLATLLILLGEPAATEADLSFDLEVPAARKDELRTLPCYVVKTREEAQPFLGFRHIGGLKKWPADAKARYLAAEVDRLAAEGTKDVFYSVGRAVGGNAQGIRNYYSALGILRYGRDEFGLDVLHIMRKRFGVWLRCMNSPDIKEFIGFNGAKSYEEVSDAFAHLKEERLKEVLQDMRPRQSRPPLLQDSRDVTDYGKVLTNERAHKMLRKYQDLAVARQIIAEAELPTRIRRIASQVEVLSNDLQRSDITDETEAAAEDLYKAARSLRAAARAAVEDSLK